jgi:hypothetical protein
MSRVPAWMVAALFLASGPVRAEESAGAPAESSKAIDLPANEFHEECMQLAAGQRLGYSFHAAAPLEFNIHYHRDGKIQYPVQKKDVTTLAGAYTSPRSDGYCLMWRNPLKKAVALEYRFGTAIGKK